MSAAAEDGSVSSPIKETGADQVKDEDIPTIPNITKVGKLEDDAAQMPPPAHVDMEKKGPSRPVSIDRTCSDATQILPDGAGSAAFAPDPLTSLSSTAAAADPVSSSADTKRNDAVFNLSEERFIQLHREEERISLLRQSLLEKRANKKSQTAKKRKRDKSTKQSDLPGWKPAAAPRALTDADLREWHQMAASSRIHVERLLDHYRLNRTSYLDECASKRQPAISEGAYGTLQYRDFFGQQDDPATYSFRCCEICTDKSKQSRAWITNGPSNPDRLLTGDDLMQCLECLFVGCAPQSSAPESKGHILQHMLLSGHNFAVSCGEQAAIFCFKCGGFVKHIIFDQEKQRLDCNYKLPFMAWNCHRVLRSFDAYQFAKTMEYGIVWKGFVATYPSSVPNDHLIATRLSLRRQALMEGSIGDIWLSKRPAALAFAYAQYLSDVSDRCKLSRPIGIASLGRTSFLSAVLQCLVHCSPLQRYFLHDAKHHHRSCLVYREASVKKMKRELEREREALAKTDQQMPSNRPDLPLPPCIACEMDRLLLSYFSICTGNDVNTAIEVASKDDDDPSIGIGSAIASSVLGTRSSVDATALLSATWSVGGMAKLSGLEQRHAHAFLQRFLGLLGKDTKVYREVIHSTINSKVDDNALNPPRNETSDVVKNIFEGKFRSVLICESCRGKRRLTEPFVSILIMLSSEISWNTAENAGKPFSQHRPLCLETCIERLVQPENLMEAVYCPTCCQKTKTIKQRTFSQLPKILCIHLKRFDFLKGKKLDDHVSFPVSGLNLGPLLSHWRETPSAMQKDNQDVPMAIPDISYDLFGTVRHVGNVQDGYCVSDVKLNNVWYRCLEEDVTEIESVSQAGAYLLFYKRRNAIHNLDFQSKF